MSWKWITMNTYEKLQSTLENILNDPFLDSSLEFYTPHQVSELHLSSSELKIQTSVKDNIDFQNLNTLELSLTHKDLLDELQNLIIQNTEAHFSEILALPYNYTLDLYFICYKNDNIYHLIELTTSYDIIFFELNSDSILNQLQKMKKTIRAQIIFTYKKYPFLVKNLFIMAPLGLWYHFFYLAIPDQKSQFSEMILSVKEKNHELQKKLIKSYLDHHSLQENNYYG